ncbi:MAG TPA: hypothetical protein VKU62_01255 [Thermoanaerobaculia bacterium]|nr:hypothetical protein [Thermoanaerobaculia bacterium]
MIKVKIVDTLGFRPAGIYVYEESPGGKISVAAVKDGIFVFSPFDEGATYAEVPPTFRVDMRTGFLSALAEALDEMHIKTDSDAKIAGTLEATRAHLRDLQEMLGIGGQQ